MRLCARANVRCGIHVPSWQYGTAWDVRHFYVFVSYTGVCKNMYVYDSNFNYWYLDTISYYSGKNGVNNIAPLLPLILYGSMMILLLASTL